ncbi:MAG: 2-oxoacid:acceptor oxidoreductase family protein, partial [Planctomycetota bacterium]
IREYLGAPDDVIQCPTDAQRELFGPTRRRVPAMIDLANPLLLGPVQNQEHYMNGVIARRNHFSDSILPFLEEAYQEFGHLTGRHYGMLSEHATDDAEVVFFSLGSAAENVEAAVDFLRDEEGAKVGSIHLNVLRPFPEAAVVQALAGKRAVIVLERTDESLSGDNPLTRDVRAALGKALEGSLTSASKKLPEMAATDMPRLFSGSYGLGSRDFRPEGILGAYEFVTGSTARQDGHRAADGTSYFVLGIDHPYCVQSERTPSLLPQGSIAVRLHSIGGWGMITTGKNLGEIIGAFGDDLAKKADTRDEFGRLAEVVHVSANPKYGSEKKGAPTSYFLVVAPERIRVNCDLRHVSVVLCCDPKAFTHCNPLIGMAQGGTFVWESSEEPEIAWQRIPVRHRQEIIDKDIQLYILPGFDIAQAATDRADLHLRMQGNAFLGAFFRVSSFLQDNGIDEARFREVVRGQYVKKFGRFGEAVVESNMTVMTEGFNRLRAVPHGDVAAPDRSTMRGSPMSACGSCEESLGSCIPGADENRVPLARTSVFDREFRAGLGYDQPASILSSVGVMAAATGSTASKYVARRETPLWLAENCTQCMECITACPDTALPNTAQQISTVLNTAAKGFVEASASRDLLVAELPAVEERVRARMLEALKAKRKKPFHEIVAEEIAAVDGVDEEAKTRFLEVFERIPFAYSMTPAVFSAKERKVPGEGGLFAIFVSDLCKGCGECVTECGEKNALVMTPETGKVNADHVSGTNFLDLLPDTPQEYLGRYDSEHPEDTHVLALKNHLMVRSHYEALVSGDGACAGCGEKSVLRGLATVTEAFMRPIYHAKAARLEEKVAALEARGEQILAALKESDSDGHERLV